MHLTVAICTWNRAELLRQTLERMTRLWISPGSSWEVIVVNNSGDDDTDSVIRDFTARLPIRPIWEQIPGLSNARNAAVAAAGGDYIIWTDDDVLVGQNWLAAYASAFALYPNAVVFGGPIEPWFHEPTPRWLKAAFHEVETAYAVRNYDCGDVPLTAEIVPFGANMAFRASVLRDLPFDPNLGRVGNTMLGGEEEVLIRSLLSRGLPGRWVADARVQHYIPPERQTIQYLRRFYEGVGATKARLVPHSNGRLFIGRPLWVWQERVTTAIQYRADRIHTAPPVWVRSLKRASMARGRFANSVKRT